MVDFSQAEKSFQQLKAQFEAGTLSESDFKSRLEELMVQDEQGAWWMIGYETERWYRHDGTNWVQVDPPGRLLQKSKPVMPTEPEVTERNSTENAAHDRVRREVAEKNSQPRVAHSPTLTKQSKPKSPRWFAYGAATSIAVILCIALGVWGVISVLRPSTPSIGSESPTEAPTLTEPSQPEFT